jgi:hypothetical protein
MPSRGSASHNNLKSKTYSVYERLGDDGLTTWHPAFLALGETFVSFPVSDWE